MNDHISIRNNKLFCSHCGGEYTINYPVAVDDLAKKVEAFSMLHEDCKKTWTEPQADQKQETSIKAAWWYNNGERGSSSMTMYNCFTGSDYPQPYPSHPLDPDDFRRCLQLLQAVPEWRKDLHKLKALSPAWSNLVDHWDELTGMFERNEMQGWKNHKKIGMYELMQKLTK